MHQGFIVFAKANGELTYPLRVEIAETSAEHAQGLMHREVLPQGMLFIFDKDALRTFHMRNVLKSLDIAFIDSDFKVVDIASKLIPDVSNDVKSSTAFQFALEVPTGKLVSMGLTIGDELMSVEDTEAHFVEFEH